MNPPVHTLYIVAWKFLYKINKFRKTRGHEHIKHLFKKNPQYITYIIKKKNYKVVKILEW